MQLWSISYTATAAKGPCSLSLSLFYTCVCKLLSKSAPSFLSYPLYGQRPLLSNIRARWLQAKALLSLPPHGYEQGRQQHIQRSIFPSSMKGKQDICVHKSSQLLRTAPLQMASSLLLCYGLSTSLSFYR